MTAQRIPFKKTFAVGLMFFAMFLGAGNVIFPPLLGNLAGENLVPAMLGFLLTGVGLPVLAIIAIARAGDLTTLAGRVGPRFGLVLTIVIYVMLGPFFGIPRSGTVSYEIAIAPYVADDGAGTTTALVIYALVFFAITAVFALYPKRIVDTVGKILAPLLFLVIAVFAIRSIVAPAGEPGQPQPPYDAQPVVEGFTQGYLTMDVIAALIIGILITNAYANVGVSDRPTIVRSMSRVALIVGAGLIIVYVALSYIGATAGGGSAEFDNGGALLAHGSRLLFGEAGGLVLGITIVLACLTTSIGLVVALSQFFHDLLPRVPYRAFVVIFSAAGALVANVGLNALIALALPVLMALYPIAMALVVLFFLEPLFDRSRTVYRVALVCTGIVSLVDGLNAAGIQIDALNAVFGSLPFASAGLGWVVPFAAGTLVSALVVRARRRGSAPAADRAEVTTPARQG